MARWLITLSVVLLLVLAAHGIVLWGVAQQVQAMTSAIAQPADPLFTRQITQQGSANAPPSLAAPSKNTENKALSAVNTAQPAIKNIAINSTKTAVVQTATVDTVSESTSTASVNTSTQASATESLTTTASATASSATTTGTAALGSTASASLTTGTATSADAAASLAQLGAWPTDTRLTYELGGYFRGELHGDAQVQWTRFAAADVASAGTASTAATATTTVATAASDANNPGNRYQVRINLGIGPISSQLISQGRIRATGLVPEAYEEQLSGTRRRTLTMDAQSAVLQDGRRLPRPDGPQELVQDTASQFVDLGQRFTSGRARLVTGETVRVWLARPGGLDEWIYEVGPAETIDLPKIGPVLAYGLTPRPIANPRGTITAQMWFAPSLQNLPVRIKVTLNNETHVDLRVKKIEQR
jgi:hypothetical protein